MLSTFLLLFLIPQLCQLLYISVPPADQIAPLGSSITFSCVIQQTPDLTATYTVHWLQNDSMLQLNPLLGVSRRSSSLDSSTCTSTLAITDVVWSDSGQYSCRLVLSNGSSLTSDSASLMVATFSRTFTTSPESKSPQVGDDPVYLFCSHGESNPLANISWIKNDQPDPSLSYVTTILTVNSQLVASSTLTISDVKPSDIGAYSCAATSALFPGDEVRSTTALLMVGSERSAPVWVEHPQQQAAFGVLNGTRVELSCTVFGEPVPSVTWQKDGVEIAGGTVLAVSTGVQSTYVIASVMRSDEGDYRCRALNIMSAEHSNAATLRLGFINEDFPEEPQNTTVFEGQEAYFKCMSPPSLPPAVVTWTRGLSQVAGEGYHVTKMGGLVITSTALLDTGFYMCTATNPISNINRLSKSSYLLVARPIELNLSSQRIQALIDTDVFISCSATGVPSPALTWTRDGTSLPSPLHPEIFVGPSNQLGVRNVSFVHEGYFECIAANEVETKTNRVFFDVVETPSVLAVSDLVTALEGFQSILTCTATGDPQPEIRWSRAGQLNSTLPSRHTQHPNGSLVISSTDRNDTGDFVCVGTNIAGEDQATLTLNVLYPPGITSQFADQLVAPGESLSLQCVAEGNPVPQISWERSNGSPASNSSLLVFTSVQSMDDGEYSCVAQNSIAVVRFSTRVVVTALPQVSIAGGAQSVIEGQSTSIECQILSGNPIPDITWSRDNQTLSQSEPRISITYSDNMSILFISQALRSDTNNYRCEATNAVGVSERSVLINILSPPATPQIRSLLPISSVPPSPTTTSLFLNWTQVDDGGSSILSYVIRYTPLLATPSLTQETVVAAAPTDFTIDSLLPYTTYEVQIYARNLIGVSTFSASQAVRLLILHPTAPTALQLNALGPYNLEVTWGEPIPANGPLAFYEIQYQLFTLGENLNRIEFLEVSAEVLSANITGLMPQSAYSVSIRAKNRDEQGGLLIGPFSQVVLGDTGFQAPSFPPTITSLSASSSGSVRITWEPPGLDIAAPVTSYLIYIAAISQEIPPAPGAQEVSALFNSTQVSGLFPYSEYLLSIASSNSKGVSSPGAERRVRTEEDVPISPVLNLTLSSNEPTELTLSWEDPPFIQVRGVIVRYDVHYKLSSEGGEFNIIRSEERNATIPGLTPFTEYEIGVAVVTGKGAGPRNDPPQVQRTAEGLPGSPTDLAMTIDEVRARLSWAQPGVKNGLLEQYSVIIRDIQSGENLVLTLPTTDTIIDPFVYVEGLLPGSNYSFSVSASTSAGQGVYSPPFPFVTPGTRPTLPPPLTVTVIVTVPVTLTTISTTQTTQNTTTSTQTSTTTPTTRPATTNTTMQTDMQTRVGTPTDDATTPIDSTTGITGTTAPVQTDPTTDIPFSIVETISFAAIVIPSVVIAILFILLVLVLICVGIYFIKNQDYQVKTKALKLRGLTEPTGSRPNSGSSTRRPISLTMSNPYQSISRGNPRSERSWYTSVRSPTKSDTMETLDSLAAEKERTQMEAGNLFTPYGYRPAALGGEPAPSPAGMSKRSTLQGPEAIRNNYNGINVEQERKQLSSPRHNGVFIFEKGPSPLKSRYNGSDDSMPPSLPPRMYIQEEPTDLRGVLEEGEFRGRDDEPEREMGLRL